MVRTFLPQRGPFDGTRQPGLGFDNSAGLCARNAQQERNAKLGLRRITTSVVQSLRRRKTDGGPEERVTGDLYQKMKRTAIYSESVLNGIPRDLRRRGYFHLYPRHSNQEAWVRK